VSATVNCDSLHASVDSVPVNLFLTTNLLSTSILGPDGQPRPDIRTSITVTLQAVAHPPRSNPVRCRSRGSLERALLAEIRRQLAKR
jgi:hypothetical protein